MIAFLVVTTMVNIGVGYALAAYLAGGCRVSTASAGEADLYLPAEAVPAQSLTIEQFPTPAIAPPGPAAHAANVANAEKIPLTVRGEDKEAQVRTAAMEQDLLAGIEEFRNQLAQLKAKASAGSTLVR